MSTHRPNANSFTKDIMLSRKAHMEETFHLGVLNH